MLTLGGLLAVGLPQAVAAQSSDTPTHTIYSRDSSKDIAATDSGVESLNGLTGTNNGDPGDEIHVSDDSANRLRIFGIRDNADFNFSVGDNLGDHSLSSVVEVPVGLHTDHTTLWVADDRSGDAHPRIVPLALTDRTASTEWNSFDLHTANDAPQGIWGYETSGTSGWVLWVVDSTDAHLYAYRLSNGTRNGVLDIGLDTANSNPRGIWSDETTIWVVEDAAVGQTDRAIAYNFTSRQRDASRDIDLDSDNADPTGAWSDGTTMWVADSVDKKLYAYHMTGAARTGGA